MTCQKKAAPESLRPGTAAAKSSNGIVFDYNGITRDFYSAIAAVGMEPPGEIIADGQIHRFSASGKRGDDAGWYVLHMDNRPAGSFGNWRLGTSHTWHQGQDGGEQSLAERQAQRRHVTFAQVVRAQEQRERQQAAAQTARVRWNAGIAVIGQGHPYLHAKGVQAHGVRIEGGHTLLAPMRDAAGLLLNLQSISPDGTKRFMPGARVTGLYHGIGQPDGRLLIAEGYATGAALHEESGAAVAVAFCANNLKPVALALRAKYPALELVICADDDWQTDGNPGLTKAREAAAAVGAKLAIPDFTGLPRGDKDTDFNDLMRLYRQAGKGGAA
jgi:putative DNA primase/helicase